MANVEVLTNARPGVAPVKEGSNEGVPLGELESEITAAAGTATLKAEPGAAYEKGQYLIRIGEELIACTLSKTELTLVKRGAEKTTAAIHAAKAQVYNVTTEEQLEKWLEQRKGPGANVLKYGADPIGVEDSTAAFKKAGEASNNIYAPAGTYLIAGTLDVSGKTLEGDGINATVLTKNGTSSAMITVTVNASPTTIRALTFTNSNHEATSGSYIKVEVTKGEAPVILENIETKFGFNCIELGLSLFVTISRTYHYKWKGNAFWFHSGANAATIRDFYCQEGTTTACGIRLEGWNPGHIFEGGEVLNAGYGLYATIEGGVAGFEHRPEDCRFTDCFFDTIYGKKETKSVGTTTAGSALIKMTVARSGVNVGDTVAGTGVPGGSTVTEVKLATNEIKISANVEAGKGGEPTLTFTNGTKNSIVRCTQCSDMRFVNCWVATNEATAKVVGFEFESCDLMACVQCISNQNFYGGFFISACTSTSLTGCVGQAGASKITYQGNTVAHFMIVGASKNTVVAGGNSKQSKSYAAFISTTSNKTDINGLGIEAAAETVPIKNEIEAAKATEVYTREGGREGSLVTTEITTWLSTKVEEASFPRAKIHAGNIEFRGTLKVKLAETIKAQELVMTAIAGYRPVGISRRLRFAYGKEGVDAPKELWVEVALNGEITTMAGSPELKAQATHEPEGKVTISSKIMTEVTSYVGIFVGGEIEGAGLPVGTKVAKQPSAAEEAAKELEMTEAATKTEVKQKYKFIEPPTLIYIDEAWFPIGKAGES